MFPAIRQALKEWWARDEEPAVQGLELKGAETLNIGFDPVSIASMERNGYNRIAAALGGGAPAWSGQSVSMGTALNHSVVWACDRIISESTAFLPLSLMREVGSEKNPATAHPMYRALHNAPNDEMTTMGFRETLTSHLVMHGNAFAQIVRRSGTGVAQEFSPLLPGQVNPTRDSSGRLVYEVKQGNSPQKEYTVEKDKPHDILHIRGLGFDGLVGYSVLSVARHSIGTALSGDKYTARFFAEGGRLPYVVELDQKWKTTQDRDQFRADWNKTYGNPETMHLAPMLEPGMHYKPIGLSASDAQLLETRQFSIPEICRWFLVSPHLVGDLSRATFCLPGDTEVYTAEGPKRIDQIRPGESVWSRGEHDWVLSTVARSACTGYDEILTIKTTNRTVRMNAKHRVLARVKRPVLAGASINGQVSRVQAPTRWSTEWIPAGELSVGDTIVNLHSLPSEGANMLPSGKPATVEFMEFCGLLAGDGNISIVEGEPVGVQIARALHAPYMDHYRAIMWAMTATRVEPDRSGEKHSQAKLNLAAVEKIRKRLLAGESGASIARSLGLCRSTVNKIRSGVLWGKPVGARVKQIHSTISEGERQTSFRNVAVARELQLLGLGGTARTKRVPGWVFGLTAELRAAYVRGFLDADGSVDKMGRMSFSSCNRELLSQVRHLCMGLGVPVTNLGLKCGQTKLPNGRIVEFRQYTFTCSDPQSNLRVGSHTPAYIERMRNGRPFNRKGRSYPRHGGDGFEEKGCELARISSIQHSLIQEPVYDLEVSETHSFIANGVVVHNSNIEHLALQFVKMTLTAWLTRWEQELWRCALTPEEKGQGYFFRHNVNGLLRGDFASRMAGYSTMLQNGIASVNQIRDLEDWNPIEGGDDHHIQLNMQSLPGGTPTASQQSALYRIGGGRNANQAS